MKTGTNQNIFRNKNFLKLWLAQVLAHPAGHILNFILIIKVYGLTQSSFAVSLLLALSVIPPILFSVIGGVMADIYNRKHLLIITNLARGILIFGFIWWGDSLTAIFLFLFINILVTQFYLPAENASIPQVVNKDELFLANSFFMFVLYVSFLIGYALAGPILHYLGETRSYALLIIMYWLAFLFDLSLPNLKSKSEEPKIITVKKDLNYLKERFQESLAFIKKNKIVVFIGSQLLFVFAVQRSIVALLPQLADKVLLFDVKQISYYLIAPVAFGALVGGIIANRLKYFISKKNLIIIGIVFDSLFLLLLPFSHFIRDLMIDNQSLGKNLMILAVMILVFISGIANVWIIIAAQTFLHEQSANRQRGRLFGNFYTLMNLLILPTVILVGFMASRFSLDTVILGMGTITLLVGFGVWFYGRRYFEHI